MYFNIFLTICQTFLIMSRIHSLFNRRSPLVLIIFASRALYRTTSTCNDFVRSNDDCTIENIAWICKLICRIQIRPAYNPNNDVQIVLINYMKWHLWNGFISVKRSTRFQVYNLNIIPSIMYYNNQYQLLINVLIEYLSRIHF